MYAVFLLLAAIGCQGEESSNAGAPSSKPAAEVFSEAVAAPHSTVKTDLAIVRADGRLHVGDTMDTANELFRPPKGSYEFSELPPHFTAPTYRAKGWDSRREGFGVLLHDSRIAFAMHQLLRSDLDTLREIVVRHKDALGYKNLQVYETAHVHYWFWTQESQCLMICGLENKGAVKITVALGDTVVTNALGISLEEAKRDGSRAEDAISKMKPTGSAPK